MDVTAAMLVEGRRHARLCEAFDRNAGAREWKTLGRMTLGTPPRPSDRIFLGARAGCKVRMERRKMAFTSSGASVCGRRDRSIRKKFIGHGMSASRERPSRGTVLLPLLRAFPRALKNKQVTNAQNFASFAGSDARVGGETVIVVEADFGAPRRDMRAAVIAEDFLEAGNDNSRVRIARGNGAARARIAALEIHFADAEAHGAPFFRAEELIFPECRDFCR